MLPFTELNPNPEKLIEVLGLDFDPDKELEKRDLETTTTQEAEIIPLLNEVDTDYLNKIRKEKIT